MHTLAYFSVVSSRICRKGHNYIIYMRVTGVTGVIVVFLLAFRNRYTMYEIKDSDSDSEFLAFFCFVCVYNI